MKPPIGSLVLLCLAAMVASGSPALAQTAQAEELFRQGKALMEEGSYEAACRKFERSAELEVTASTLLNLGNCREKNGQIATAWAVYLRAVAEARDRNLDAELLKSAQSRASALEQRVPYLTIDVVAEVLLEGMAITVDGVTIADVQWNDRMPLDPGDHQVVVSAPDHRARAQTVSLQEAESLVVRIEALEPLPAELGATAPPPADEFDAALDEGRQRERGISDEDWDAIKGYRSRKRLRGSVGARLHRQRFPVPRAQLSLRGGALRNEYELGVAGGAMSYGSMGPTSCDLGDPANPNDDDCMYGGGYRIWHVGITGAWHHRFDPTSGLHLGIELEVGLSGFEEREAGGRHEWEGSLPYVELAPTVGYLFGVEERYSVTGVIHVGTLGLPIGLGAAFGVALN
jgi:hypothetical protein